MSTVYHVVQPPCDVAPPGCAHTTGRLAYSQSDIARVEGCSSRRPLVGMSTLPAATNTATGTGASGRITLARVGAKGWTHCTSLRLQPTIGPARRSSDRCAKPE